MASNRGPSAVVSPPNYANDSAYYKSRDASHSGNSYSWAQASSGNALSGAVGGSWGATATDHQATPSIEVNSVSAVGGGVNVGVGTGVSDGSYEKQLVLELCPPGGMKPEPPKDRLDQFSKVVSSLNPDLVCPALLDCLEEGQPWIIRAKALCVMETCIKHGQKSGESSNAYADFLRACNGEFAPLANHSRQAIRDPAKRVLNFLGVATPVGGVPVPPAKSTSVHSVDAAPAPIANLLDLDGKEATLARAVDPPSPKQSSLAPLPTSIGAGSLFGGLHMAPASHTEPVTESSVVSDTQGDNNLLDLMSASAVAPTTSADKKSSFEFMNSDTSSPSPPEVASACDATTAFGNLSMTGMNEPARAKPARVGSAGSSFGFINGTASGKDSAPATPSTSTPTATSFDPLINVTPNGQKQTMAMSPEQMQALMYQQVMMQQQMQMAQMQMAMQQHQKLASNNPQMMFMNMPGHVMQNPAASKSTFAFMDKPRKEEDKSFDFVKDAMKSEK